MGTMQNNPYTLWFGKGRYLCSLLCSVVPNAEEVSTTGMCLTFKTHRVYIVLTIKCVCVCVCEGGMRDFI